MRKYRIVGSAALLVVLLFIVGRSCRKREEKVLRADSKDLKHTIITAHLEEKIVPGKNLIYCSTFQLAWNELCDKIHNEDIRLQDEPPMVKILNKKLTTKADLSEDCYLAMAGFGKNGILKNINRALRSKFGAITPTLQGQFAPQDVVAYGFLEKDLKFATPFESLKKPIEFRSGSSTVEVEGFGIKEFRPEKAAHAKLAEQFSIVHYRGPRKDDHTPREEILVVRLFARSRDEEIILAQAEPGPTLLNTINSVDKALQKGRSVHLSRKSTLRIPKLDFDIRHSYGDLLGKNLQNADFTGYHIAWARQDIRFRLNERGATLRSWALFGVKSELRPIFSGPFLLYLKEKTGKYPYLAIWVDNPEILMKR